MMRMRTKTTAPSPTNGSGRAAGAGVDNEWEMRPGGMLVQKRNPDADQNRVNPPTIRVRVKYGSIYHEINISSQATFGELKKMLSGPTGLHHEDQKLLFKDKERDSKAFLDIVGVKDRSKIVLVEDPISQEKRFLEMRKNAKMEKASKSISEISLEVDRLGGQVSALESVISKGGKVAEKELLNPIEMLMNQLLKLDGIIAEGDVKLQRKMQVKRVQKYVETLDVLKIKNSRASSNGNHIPVQQPSPVINGNHIPLQQPSPAGNGNHVQLQQPSPVSSGDNHVPTLPPSSIQRNQEQRYSNGHNTSPTQHQQSRRTVGHYSPVPSVSQQQQNKQQSSRHTTSGAVVVTTQWETFDSMPTPLPAPPSTSTSSSNNTTHPKIMWDLL